MPVDSPPVPSPIENVIPDCCNMGVIFRSLLAVNVAVLAGSMLQTPGFRGALLTFVEASMLTELACLISLFALCGLRRVFRTVPAWGQRLVCAIVPGLLTAAIIRYLLSNVISPLRLTDIGAFEGFCVAALFGITLQHYFEMRTRAFSPALAEARLQALQARIKPHFLFNSLNAVLSLIRTEPRKAESALEDLSDLFRVLMRDARDITSLHDEIRLCRQYLSIEKIRLGERLQVEWETAGINDDVMRRAQVPALLLQPLLENAVHYGVEPSHALARICIVVTRSLDRIDITVVNPYHAEVVSLGNHMALENIRERLALLYDVEAQISAQIINDVYEVRLRLPYVKAA